MAKKKRDEPGTNGTAGTGPADVNGTHTEPVATVPPSAPGGTGSGAVKSIAVAVGDGSMIEGWIWPREVTKDGKALTTYTATVRKSYRGEDEECRHTGSFKGSEIPIVQYVLGCCAEWILAQRREDDPPF